MAIAISGAPELSIIIPCLGHAAELEVCLQSLSRQAELAECEVLVVDSNWDEGVAAAAGGYPFVRLIRSRENLSPGQARNLGARSTAAAWLAFLDADCFPHARDWTVQARQTLRAGHYLSGGPVLDVRPNHPIGWADNRLQFADFQRGRPAGPARYLPGCNLLMPRRLFDELGGFVADPREGEDTLLSGLAESRFPGKVYFEPRLRVRHHGRENWKAFLAHQRSLGQRRSYSRLQLDPSYRFMLRQPLLAGLVILRRLGYISVRTIQFDRAGVIRLVLFLPWLIAGLISWTAGFYAGASTLKDA